MEEQTRKLFDVCRMRRLPIFTFVNKCDRAGVDPLQLLDDVEADLGIRRAPVTWPVLDGVDCIGVYDRRTNLLHRFRRSGEHGATRVPAQTMPRDSPQAEAEFPPAALDRLREDIELLDAAGAALGDEPVRQGRLSPTFFGSALLNFGVEPFLEYFLENAPPPAPREADGREIGPAEPEFRGFVFKIQANMDSRHRDRIAFVRIVSGRYEAGMRVTNLGTGETVRLGSARRFLAAERTVIEHAVAGDVVGIHDRGSLRVGDTLSEDGGAAFDGIPRFSPEHFARVRLGDPLRRKHLDRALRQLSEEGAIQVFFPPEGSGPRQIVGAVGALQFEVLLHRLEHEYGVEAALDPLAYRHARWALGEPADIRKLAAGYQRALALDHRGRPLVLFESDYSLRKAAEDAPGVELRAVSPTRTDGGSPGRAPASESR